LIKNKIKAKVRDMAQKIINNGETGLSIRTKINQNFKECYQKPESLLDLSDTPISFEGQAGKLLSINETEDGIVFVAGSVGGVSKFTSLDDTPGKYTSSNALYSTNSDKTGIVETDVLLTAPAINQFQLTRGSSSLFVNETECTIDQDLQKSSGVLFKSLELSDDLYLKSTSDFGVKMLAPESMTEDLIFELPDSMGSAGQVMKTNGLGGTFWGNVSGGSGGSNFIDLDGTPTNWPTEGSSQILKIGPDKKSVSFCPVSLSSASNHIQMSNGTALLLIKPKSSLIIDKNFRVEAECNIDQNLKKGSLVSFYQATLSNLRLLQPTQNGDSFISLSTPDYLDGNVQFILPGNRPSSNDMALVCSTSGVMGWKTTTEEFVGITSTSDEMNLGEITIPEESMNHIQLVVIASENDYSTGNAYRFDIYAINNNSSAQINVDIQTSYQFEGVEGWSVNIRENNDDAIEINVTGTNGTTVNWKASYSIVKV